MGISQLAQKLVAREKLDIVFFSDLDNIQSALRSEEKETRERMEQARTWFRSSGTHDREESHTQFEEAWTDLHNIKIAIRLAKNYLERHYNIDVNDKYYSTKRGSGLYLKV